MLEGVTEYVVNGAWQIPLLAAGAWLLVKMIRPSVLVQHGLWLSVLVMSVVLPLRGLEGAAVIGGRSTLLPNATTTVAVPSRKRSVEALSLQREVLNRGLQRPLTRMCRCQCGVAALYSV